MIILHITAMRTMSISGMAVAVPQHVVAQQRLEQVGVINVTGDSLAGVQNQFNYDKEFCFSNLPEPFCRPDLIVFHGVYLPAYLKLYRKAKRTGIPYVVVPHGSFTKQAQRKKWLKKTVANILLFRPFVNKAVAIQYLTKREQETSNLHKVNFIGANGINMPNAVKNEWHAQRIKMAYVGRMETRIKGLDILIGAIGHIAGDLRRAHTKVALFGPCDGNERMTLKRLIGQFGVEDLVELCGPVVGEQKERELLDADLFIQTSRTEGLPMGVLEALSYGIPCVVTEGTNLGDYISAYDAGWVAKVSVESVAETILQAVNQRCLWEKKGRNGRRMIEEKFLWEKVAKGTIAEYQNLIDP